MKITGYTKNNSGDIVCSATLGIVAQRWHQLGVEVELTIMADFRNATYSTS